ncbi:hypothetical protein WJX84_004893 [Apatococcus fuscideae]|uniref:Hexosyltransferase n=1 Tax=Apatococcus fuscideae TaxID=2026836 RepID=A0AAW1T8R1_9CHLO
MLTQRPGPVYVEFVTPGLYLPVSEALSFNLPIQPAEAYLLRAMPLPQSRRSISGAQPNLDGAGLTERSLPHPDDYDSSDNGEYYGSIKPYRRLQEQSAAEQAEVTMFVAVTSTCCNPKAQARRDAIRQSWMRRARSVRQHTVVKFFLAQPAQDASFKDAVKMLEHELLKHNDTVVLRGMEEYARLPSKTFGLLRYAASLPLG